MRHVLQHRLAVATFAIVLSAAPGVAQAPAPKSAEQGGALLAAKCAQCHTDSMWRDQRQSATAWEATLYRMIGRGALWEPDEVRQMAEYLGADFGPNAAKPAPAQK